MKQEFNLFSAIKVTKRKRQRVLTTQIYTSYKDIYFPLWEASDEYELDCDITFGDKSAEVSFYDDLFKLLSEKATQVVQVSSFDLAKVVNVKTNRNDLNVMDYFEAPMEPQQGSTYKGRVKLKFKWLVKTQQGFVVKPKILCFYLLYKY